MADSKGLYFGGGNTGLATILPRENKGDFFDLALRDQAYRRRQKAKEDDFKLKQRQKDIDKIKNFESWRFYSPAIQNDYKEVIDMVKSDNYDPVDLQMRVNEIAQLSQSSMQLQDEYKAAQTAYKADKKVVGAEEWYLDSYHSNGTKENLKLRQEEGQDPYAFLKQPGGSQYVNTSEAFEDVINGAFKDFVIQKSLSDPTRSYIGTGLQQLTQQEVEAKFRNFAQLNPVTGEIQVKDVDKLIDDGVLTVFLKDPYTNRIIEDEALKLAKGEPVNDEHRAIALRSHLSPRSAGTYDSRTNVRTAREAVDFVARRGKEEAQNASDWLVRVKRGDITAWEELTRTKSKDGNGIITGVQEMGENGTVRLLIKEEVPKLDKYGEKIPGETEIKTRYEYIPYQQMSDEDLLGWYGQALTRPKGSRVNDKNRPSSKGYLDNITEDNYDL